MRTKTRGGALWTAWVIQQSDCVVHGTSEGTADDCPPPTSSGPVLRPQAKRHTVRSDQLSPTDLLQRTWRHTYRSMAATATGAGKPHEPAPRTQTHSIGTPTVRLPLAAAGDARPRCSDRSLTRRATIYRPTQTDNGRVASHLPSLLPRESARLDRSFAPSPRHLNRALRLAARLPADPFRRG